MQEAPGAEEEDIQFECTITNQRNIRVLAAAFACLAKLGKEVSLEAQEAHRTLTLRCVNEAKTSFVSFEFRKDFFEDFAVMNPNGLTALIKIRNCLAVFRSIKTMETLTLSLMRVGGTRYVVVFRATCDHSITKTHQFYFEDTEVVDPLFDRDSVLHRVRARPKLLIEALRHIHGAHEISFEATSGIELKIASQHHHQLSNQDRMVNTEMRIPEDDFEEFSISEPKVRLIFSVKEFRALLGFCEANGVDISDVFLLFNESGSPLMFTTASRVEDPLATVSTPGPESIVQGGGRPAGHFTFTLVLATIPDNEPTEPAANTSFVADTVIPPTQM